MREYYYGTRAGCVSFSIIAENELTSGLIPHPACMTTTSAHNPNDRTKRSPIKELTRDFHPLPRIGANIFYIYYHRPGRDPASAATLRFFALRTLSTIDETPIP